MLNIELIKNVLMIAMASSIVSTAFVQKIKETIEFKKSSRVVIVSFVVSMVLGTLFSLSFSNTNLIYSLWVGLVSFIGADTLYKLFEEKLFKTYGEIHKNNIVEVPKDNIIK